MAWRSLLLIASTAHGIVFTPVGRSYFSTNATASAEFFHRYLGAQLVPQNLTNESACAVVTAVTSHDISMIFVEDKVKPDGPVPVTDAIDALAAGWKVVMSHEQLYSQWFDNHDGYGSEEFNVENAFKDGLEMQVYHDDKTEFPAAVVRTHVPGTAWTLETAGHYTVEQGTKLDQWRFQDPDNCRNNSAQDNITMPYWWKSTFAANDPAAAAEFAVAVLGATPAHSPYPWPKQPNCTVATWVTLPNSTFMLHFVASAEYSTGHRLSVKRWAQSQERFRNLAAGVFDRQMYNALVLWTDDLDPLIDRLEELGVPFLPLQMGAHLYALQLDVPNNGFSLQIKSHKLTKVVPQRFDPCSSLGGRSILV